MHKITLKAARVNAGLSQSKVARLLGVNIATISSWETGKTKPSLENFKKLCQIFDWPEEGIKWDERSN